MIPTQAILDRIGAKITDRRQALRLTQEKVAEACGLHRTYISDIERARRNVSVDTLNRLAMVLQITVGDFFV